MNPTRRLILSAASRVALPAALLGASAALMAPAHAQGPKQNLQVELRWVESELSGATVAGLRDGSTVVSTGGSVSAREPGRTLAVPAPPHPRVTVRATLSTGADLPGVAPARR